MESISRISGLMETARDLTLEAARDASSLRKPASHPLPTPQLKKLLDSRHEREVLDGLRRIIAISQRNPSPSQGPLLFSSVIKNIASPSLPVKKLVYIYVLQHAEAEPDTALLAINTIQKSLSAQDPYLRALALRVMSGIRVPVISQIVSLGIKKSCADMSPIVRKAAALAIPKCWRLDPATSPQLTEYLSILLGDKQYFVAGAAVISFMEVCPEQIDLIHKHYRSLVRKLVDMDEWGQLATLQMMTVYARKCFPRRTKKVRKERNSGSAPAATKGFYDDEDEPTAELNTTDETEEVSIMDPDLDLLLKAALPLLQSRNSAVVIAVTRCYLALSPPNDTTYIDGSIGPIISLLRGAQDTQQIALYNIVQVALVRPVQFVRYATHFLVRMTDSPQIWRLKLELLTIIFPHGKTYLQSLILGELAHFCSGGGASVSLMREAVGAIGRCAQSSAPGSPTAKRCLRLLLGQVDSTNGELVAEALTVIRHLIQADPTSHVQTVIRLAKSLDTMTHPQARATIIWLVGEFAGIDPENNIAADVLRILAKGFADEAEAAKLQIVLLAAKVYVHHLNLKQQQQNGSAQNQSDLNLNDPTTDPIALLWTYILLLARYDTSYDLRDRARVYRALLAIPSSTQLASLLLLAPKPVPQAPSPSESRRAFTLGSASLVVGAEAAGLGGLRGYETLPNWVIAGREPSARLRDEAGGGGSASVSHSYLDGRTAQSASERLDAQSGPGAMAGEYMAKTVNAPVEKSLDDWLAEDETASESIEESDDEPEEDEDSEEESEDDDDDEEEEEESEDEEDEEAKLVKS